MTIDVSKARDQADFSEIIPHGALSFGVIKIRPFNLDANVIPTPSKSSDAHYLDCEITLAGGAWDKRKIWTKIGIAGSQAYINMGMSAMKAIRETGVGASVQNPALYSMNDYMELDGLTVGVKIKIESSPGYNDKNEIAVFLSPVQDGVKKIWDKLVAGDCAPDPNAIIAKRNPKVGAAAGGVVQEQAPRWAAGAAAPAAGGTGDALAKPASPPPATAASAGTPAVAAAAPAAPAAAASVSAAPPWVAAQGAPVQSPK